MVTLTFMPKKNMTTNASSETSFYEVEEEKTLEQKIGFLLNSITRNFCFIIGSMNIHSITNNAKWKQNGTTVATGHSFYHNGIYVDDDQTIYIAQEEDHSVVKWKYNTNRSQVVAGGNGYGKETNQLSSPLDVTIDKASDSIIICDRGNDRVMRWSLQNSKNGEIIISKVACYSLTMDNQGFLYVVNFEKDEVRRWKIGNSYGTIVAGENGRGNHTGQLHGPRYIFVDQDHSVYVSDYFNYRVMKWMEGAKEGIVVAGGQDQGNSLKQFSNPRGIVVDPLGNVYVADRHNYRVMRWIKDATEGGIVVGGNGCGDEPNQFDTVGDISFDRYGNLYVVDEGNNRVQQFLVDSY
jgi:sugar lactone lactonase YvrE